MQRTGCELFKALERFELLETFERLELSLPKSFLHGARSISIAGANDAADKPTEMFAVEPAYVETAGAICIEIRNRLAAPKIDSPLIIGGDVGAGSAAPVKKGDFVICAGSSRANEE